MQIRRIIKMNKEKKIAMRKNLRNKIFLIAFISGMALLALNIYGLFIPLGNADIYSEQHTLYKNDVDKNAQSLLNEVINEKKITNREEYFKKVVLAVNKNIAHYWWNEGRVKYNLTIPIYKNYILWFKQFTDSRHYKFYEFCNYKRALKRKVGLCSQHAISVCGILEAKKIPCKIVALSGHVVAMAEVKTDKYWVLDADYDVILPYSIDEIEQNPSIIIPYYKGKMPYSNYALQKNEKGESKNAFVNAISLEKMVDIFGPEGNYVVSSVEKYCGDKYFFEEMSFYLIWIFALLLILPFVVVNLLKI